jgi:capsid assembly protease
VSITAFAKACSVPWAIRPEVLTSILTIAAEEHAPDWSAIEAVAAKRQKRMDDAREVGMRDGVAIINIAGPIFRHANLMSEYSGASSVSSLAQSFNAAVESPEVKAILLNIDSPGGEVAGINEFAQQIYDARGKKRLVAYVDGDACSAAYWLASAADEIVTDQTGILGSIGVVSSVADPTKRTARDVQFVSSQSPNKRPDPTTESGKGQIQTLVDSLADVFVQTVARNRGVSVETVLESFGQGGVLVGAQAVEAGLADRLGSFESLIAELGATKRKPMKAAHAAQEGENMTIEDMKAAVTESFSSTLAALGINKPAAIEIPADTARSVAVAEMEAKTAKDALFAIQQQNAKAEASAFAQTQLEANRILPAEAGTVEALYAQAAADDFAMPLAEGSRVALIKADFASRPAHTLTKELTSDDKTQVLAADADAQPGAMTAERQKELLEMTALGQSALKAVK